MGDEDDQVNQSVQSQEGNQGGSRWKLPSIPTKGLRCPNCGSAHPKPELVETYRYCTNCAKVMRESMVCVLPKMVQRSPSGELNKLAILAASFGHPTDPLLAINVLEEIRNRVVYTSTTSELELPLGVNLITTIFKSLADPAPGAQKMLCIRYIVPNFNSELTRHGEVLVMVNKDGSLMHPLRLYFKKDSLPKVWINRATYGHRHSNTQGLVFDVTERLTGMADLNGGDYLSVPAASNLQLLFGEPCEGMTKTLTIDYEIIGRTGQARQYEIDGHLIQDIIIQNLPVVAPSILIEKATYGWQPKDIELKIIDLQAHGKLTNQSKEMDIKKYQSLLESKDTLKDITSLLQQRIDDGNVPGSQLNLSMDINLNLLFGDPSPGLPRFLLLEYALLGYGDSNTDDEIIKKGNGQSRNFSIRKAAKLKLQVSPEGFLAKPVAITSQEIFPSLSIARAFFGHPTNILKTFDVTEPIGVLAAKGNASKSLVIPRTMNLTQMFGDPCRGIRKALTINYQVLGMGGTLTLQTTESGHLLGNLVLGYPPEKQDKGIDCKLGFSERIAITAAKTKQTARERMKSSASQRLWSN